MKNLLLPTKDTFVQVTLKGETGMPLSYRVDVPKLQRIATIVVLSVLTLSLGTLLFFRELELNRHLQTRVLELTAKEQMAGTRPVPAMLPTSPLVETNPAKLTKLNTTCLVGRCIVSVSLVPVFPGNAIGELALVLETDTPRIGSPNTAQAPRKLFYFYPVAESKEDYDVTKPTMLARKGFDFARALETTVEFKTGLQQKPAAIHLYLFDKNHNLIAHEKKRVEPSHE